MSSISSWMYLALWFLGPLAVASVIGCGCYLFVHWMDEAFPELLAVLEVFLACGVLYFSLAAFPWGMVPLGILTIICGVGTLAEGAILPMESSWKRRFVRLFYTTACCMVLSFGVLALLASSGGLASLAGGSETWFITGILLGAVCSPSVVPVFLWVWQSSWARPGVERHLTAEERAQGE